MRKEKRDIVKNTHEQKKSAIKTFTETNQENKQGCRSQSETHFVTLVFRPPRRLAYGRAQRRSVQASENACDFPASERSILLPSDL